MGDLFDFANMNNKTKKLERPSKEQVLKDANAQYDSFEGRISITREQYLKNVITDYETLMNMDDEMFEANLIERRITIQNSLAKLTTALDNKILQVKEAKRKKEEEERIKEEKKLKNKIKKLFLRCKNYFKGKTK